MLSQTRKVKVLLGGVPFGRDNIGDEAILECSIALLRQYCPEAQITAATGDPENTARRLGINTCTLIGFPGHEDEEEIGAELQNHDVFIWCGATGLSDYPETPLRIMAIAQRLGKKTMLWGVGMNSELNPALYRVQPGRRSRVLSLVNTLSLHAIDAIRWQERLWERRVHRKIRACLNRADLIVVRDAETKQLLQNIGVVNEITVGGDAAISLEPAPWDALPLDDATRDVLQSPKRKLGVCISAQRAVRDRAGLIDCLDRVTENGFAHIVFIPMNPVTDRALMRELQQAMKHPEKTTLLHDIREPRHVMTVVSALDAVLSSRLHLLIFASNAAIPMIAIARGSKFDNYLRHYDLAPTGSVEACDFVGLARRTMEMTVEEEGYRTRNADIHAKLEKELRTAAAVLAATIRK